VGAWGGGGCVGDGVVVRVDLWWGWGGRGGRFNDIGWAVGGLGVRVHAMLFIEIGLHRCNEIFGLSDS
jgi:hypothetical protein